MAEKINNHTNKQSIRSKSDFTLVFVTGLVDYHLYSPLFVSFCNVYFSLLNLILVLHHNI